MASENLPSHVETRIQETREIDHAIPPFRFSWLDSGDFTQFLLRWCAKPKVFSLSQIFANELKRRRGLRAYGAKIVNRRSKINQIGSSASSELKPRPILEVAKTEAA